MTIERGGVSRADRVRGAGRADSGGAGRDPAGALVAAPFEHLDIVPLGRTIPFDTDALAGKIVRRRREGLCYE